MKLALAKHWIFSHFILNIPFSIKRLALLATESQTTG